MGQRPMDIFLSLLATGIAFLLSWPFWRNFEYWAESQELWLVYFVTGYALAAYVFYIFLNCLRTLFLHDALVRSGYVPTASVEEEKGDLP